MTFEHRVLSFCREQGLLERGSRVICAVSGGADSMALVWCLYLLREPLELTISAAHFNHGLRGGESDRDEEFVRRFCADYGIGLTVGRGQIRAQGRGLEDAARPGTLFWRAWSLGPGLPPPTRRTITRRRCCSIFCAAPDSGAWAASPPAGAG